MGYSGSVGLCTVVWILSGFISSLSAMCVAELSTVVPKSGGAYAYFFAAYADLHQFFGPLPSFLYMWVILLINTPCSLALTSMIFASYVYGTFRPLVTEEFNSHYETILKDILGISVLLAVGIMNYFSTKSYSYMQNYFTVSKMFGCLYVILGGLYMVVTGKGKPVQFTFDGSKITLDSLVMAFYYGIYTYNGWSSVAGVTEEIKKPDKNILRSVILSLATLTVLFVMMNYAYLTAMSIPDFILSDAVAVDFGNEVFGRGKIIISVFVAMSLIGSSLSTVFYSSRLWFAAARNGQVAEFLSYIHKKRMTPTPAVIVEVGLALIFFLLGRSIVDLIKLIAYLIWIFNTLTMITVYVLRYRQPLANRPHKVLLVVPALVATVYTVMTVVPLITQPPTRYIVSALLVLLGIVFYYPFVFRQRPAMSKVSDKLSRFIQDILHVEPQTAE
ncbi:b(0,+)-type amino acid transporter 1-like isoform X3 [Homalodisca vitripennis]|nr:b(0,+)-type amino acid transporter 1-like isoform X3 [Homalodisca vitripennis]XP_046675797.1 b(0,+)-type amino acid transporter 1-like isoform X3 [Homalodisca vitripennis]